MSKLLRAWLWCAVSSEEQAHDDKESLRAQEANARKLCEQHGYRVDHIIRISESRDYDSIHEAIEEGGVVGYEEFLRGYRTRAFDVLVARDTERLGRSVSLCSEMIRKTCRIGFVHLVNGGIVRQSNATMVSAMGGFKAQSDVERFVELTRMGMNARVLQEHLSGNRPPMSHVIITEGSGKKRTRRLAFNQEKRRFFDDLAELVIAGVGYLELPHALAQRGHVNEKRKERPPYHSSSIYKILFNPYTYGNVARNFADKRYGEWAWNPTAELPEGVQIVYDVIEHVWPPEIELLVISELLRRLSTIQGRARSDTTYRFTGLLVCDECRYNMRSERQTWKKTGAVWHYYRCPNRNDNRKAGIFCNNIGLIKEEVATDQIDAFLREYSRTRDIYKLIKRQDTTEQQKISQQAQIESDIADITERLEYMINMQATPRLPDTTRLMYSEKILQLSEQLSNLEATLKKLTSSIENRDTIRLREQSLDRFDPDTFWKMTDTEINQELFRIMGDFRFLVRQKQIVDIWRKPR